DRSAFEILQVRQVHNRITLVKSCVVESTFRQSPDQRHLSTFKSQTETSARASLLSFVPFATGLAVARAFSAAESLYPMTRTRPWAQIMQPQPVRFFFFCFRFHDACPPSAGALTRGRIPRTFKISSRRRKFRSA